MSGGATWMHRALSSGHISRHMITHTKVKPFGCDWEGCNQRFSQKTHLRTHLLQVRASNHSSN
jgi:uncharacterized Zn-finger protein